jgi:hypothetical protein
MSKKAAATEVLKLFVPITKIDAVQRMVYGIAAVEQADKSGEIFDYESSKPLFQAWSADFEKATDGKSKGNVRAMHGKVAAGKVTAIEFDDAQKSIPIASKVVDDDEWAKVAEGVYTGFSIGGEYLKRWKDEPTGLMRYTANPSEISLVDNPCMPGAMFTMVKADGVEEQRAFKATVEPEPAPAAEPQAVAKDAPAAIALANDALASLKALVAETSLMPGEPDTWSLDNILCAIRLVIQAKASAELTVATDAVAGADGGSGTPVTSSPATGSAQGTPAAKVEEPASKVDAGLMKVVRDALAPLLSADAIEKTLASIQVAEPPQAESSTEALQKVVAPVVDLLTKLVTMQEAAGSKSEDLAAGLAKVTESVGGLEGRLATIENRPAPIGRPAQKVLGSGDPEPGKVDIDAMAKAVDGLVASGALPEAAEREVRLRLAQLSMGG